MLGNNVTNIAHIEGAQRYHLCSLIKLKQDRQIVKIQLVVFAVNESKIQSDGEENKDMLQFYEWYIHVLQLS